MKTLIIGLGNPIVRDDSVGLRVAARLQEQLAERPDVDVVQDYWGGLKLMERMVGYDRAIVVDAIQTGAEPGTLHRLDCRDVPTQRSASAHDVNLPTALELGRRAGQHLPRDEQIILIGIEVEDIVHFGETCTPAVEAAIPRAVAETLRALQELDADPCTNCPSPKP